nr:arrestin domain-containing protein 3-like [Leptinotarsa decemlineata]XP_023014661.1 arrestin domain-containing protein 3-like [Leptinotarsa decemlineata]
MSCTIVLQNFDGSYYPGSSISGYVVCTFVNEKKIRGVRVKLRGTEQTSWWERESYWDSRQKKTSYKNVHYTGKNKFLSETLILFGKGTMNPGRYEYPFTFILPRNLPETFKGIHGYIIYYIKANVDIPFAIDYEDEKMFDVPAPIDFNDIKSQLALAPSSYQDEKTVCCCCCADGPITLDVHLQKEAFVVGENAKIVIDVKNFSNKNIDRILLTLKTVITYTTTSPSRHHKYFSEVLASTSAGGVGAHGQSMLELAFEIPTSATVFNFNRCTLFQQSFTLEVKAELPGLHLNMNIKIGLVIGHIPIRGVQIQPFHHILYPSSAIRNDLPPPYPLQNATAPQEDFSPTAPVEQ